MTGQKSIKAHFGFASFAMKTQADEQALGMKRQYVPITEDPRDFASNCSYGAAPSELADGSDFECSHYSNELARVVPIGLWVLSLVLGVAILWLLATDGAISCLN